MDEFLAFANLLADASANAILPYANKKPDATLKADQSPVTLADQAAEEAMRSLIERDYPDHGILGEEGESFNLDRDYVWVLDPIDGTRAFLAGSPAWGTLIALCHHGEPILGILNQPVTKERWVGLRGGATTYNGEAVTTRDCASLDEASISSTSMGHFTPAQETVFLALAEQCGVSASGGDCYAYGLIARGKHDLVVDAGLKPYDILALRPIVEGAGGKVTGWNGKPVTLTNFSTVLAAGDARLHNEALELLRTPI